MGPGSVGDGDGTAGVGGGFLLGMNVVRHHACGIVGVGGGTVVNEGVGISGG